MEKELSNFLSRRIIMWGTICGALATIGGVIAGVATSEWRPALAYELHETKEQLAGSIAGVDRLVTEQALNANQLRLYQNQREQTQLQQQNLPIPNWLIQEQVDLESQKRELEHRLKELEQ